MRGPDARLVKQRGEPQLDEAVEVVVARRAVGAERDRDAGRDQLGDWRDARGELEVRRRAVADVRAARSRAARARRRDEVDRSGRCSVRRRAGRARRGRRCCPCRTAARTSATSPMFSLAWVWMPHAARASPARRPRAAARRCTTARSAARTRSAAGRRRRRASARSARRTRRATPASSRAAPAGSADRARPSSPCRSSRGCRSARRRRRSRRCDAPCPCRGSRSCRRAAARRTRARRARASRRLVERGLVRPDHAAQPVEQLEVVGAAARERLAGVDVRLDQAGHHDAAGAVDDRVVARAAACTSPPTWTIAPSTHATSPASTRCAGSIVRIVPPRKISLASRAARRRENAVGQAAAPSVHAAALALRIDRGDRDRRPDRRRTRQHLAAAPHGAAGGDASVHDRDCLELRARRQRPPRRSRCARRTRDSRTTRSRRWRR